VTKRINRIRQTPGVHVWQRNYYDHIIRDDIELDRVREYIVNNPVNWETDEEYKGNHDYFNKTEKMLQDSREGDRTYFKCWFYNVKGYPQAIV
jgi:hypothetical protein